MRFGGDQRYVLIFAEPAGPERNERILVVMKPVRGPTRRFLPTSPFNNMPPSPPVERFDVQDQVTHDSYGLGRVLQVEDEVAVIVAFGSRRVWITWPYAKLTKL